MEKAGYDFVIIGSGAGGLAAAVSARLAGMTALVVEKTSLIGGSTSLSGGNLWLPNNPLMARAGVADTREAGLRYMANFLEDSSPPTTVARQEAFADAISPMIALYEGAGMRYELSPGFSDNYDHLPGGHPAGRVVRAALYNTGRLGSWKTRLRPPSMPLPMHAAEGGVMLQATHSWEGRAMVARIAARTLGAKLTGRTIYGTGAALQGRMLEIALRLGVTVWTDARMVGLDTRGGQVAGVHVERDGASITVGASRGVLVASAGFARNREMRERYMRPPVSADLTQASPGETGDALAIFEEAGAALSGLDDAIWLMSWAAGDALRPIMSEPAKPHSILVDASGRRFVNEGRPTDEIGRACFAGDRDKPAIPAWFVADAQARKRYLFAFNLPGRVPKKWIEQGWVKQDDTLSGLARQCGIDPAGLESTVARFNGFCETGIDEDFQRGDNVHTRAMGDPAMPHPNFGPISTPPFWAAPVLPSDVGTYGGAVTDPHGRVLRTDGSVIEGLYAAGNCTAPLTGPWYTGPGLSIAVSTAFGHLAAQHAASA